MSNEVKQETGHVLGDDRDYFEDDFRSLVPGSWTELPEGYDVPAAEDLDPRFTAFVTRDIVDELPATSAIEVGRETLTGRPVLWAIRLNEHDNGKPATRDIRLEGVDGEFQYVGYLSRQQLHDAETTKAIADLRDNGAVTIIDGKTGFSMDADAYSTAALSLLGGAALPYEDPSEASPATDWAHAAVRGVIDELRDRGGIGHALQDVDPLIRQEIVESLSDIVRAAFIRRAA
ncbi:hypothetical protein OS035_24420 [Rhizobium sp. 268]|uniref:hypothetical protein n=1 Tax=Rhizobium sp. 268 TaxID=2996375 RepID=UPI002F953B14